MTFLGSVSESQTIFDPDEPGRGAVEVRGGTYPEPPREEVRTELRYVRRGISADENQRALILSSMPFSTFSRFSGQRNRGIALEIPAGETPRYVSGMLMAKRGVKQASWHFPVNHDEYSSWWDLPPFPITVRGADISLPPSAMGNYLDDTTHVEGTLAAATKALAAETLTPVDVLRANMERRSVTYRFSRDDTVTVTGRTEGKFAQTKGTWSVEGDTLRLYGDGEESIATISLDAGRLHMQFDTVLCDETGDDSDRQDRCADNQEWFYGVTPGTLQRAVQRLDNRLTQVEGTEMGDGSASDREVPADAGSLSGLMPRPALPSLQ